MGLPYLLHSPKTGLSFSSRHSSRTGKSGKVSSALKVLLVGKKKDQFASAATHRLITL